MIESPFALPGRGESEFVAKLVVPPSCQLLSQQCVNIILHLATQCPWSDHPSEKLQSGQLLSIVVLNEIQAGVQPRGVRSVVETRVPCLMVLRSKNALSQNCPLQSVVGFAGLTVKEKRAIVEPSGRRVPNAVLAQRSGGVRKL